MSLFEEKISVEGEYSYT
jgi:hypothetical protein